MGSIYIKKVFVFLKHEIFVLLLMLSSLFFFVGITKHKISSDGVGYYDYLPSIFIHNDLNRIHSEVNYSRIDSMSVYIEQNGYKVNKFNSGVALLQLPFFLTAYICSNIDSDIKITGYEIIFHNFVFLGALFYFFLSLFFLHQTLKLFDIKNLVSTATLFLFGLSTNVIQYINGESMFSHVYCMFLISTFIFGIKKFEITLNFTWFYLGLISFGLLLITRPIDILILFALPFILGSYTKTKEVVSIILQNKLKLVYGLIIVLCILSIQNILWYLQCGKLFVDTYYNEHFNFFNPEFLNFWFSYRKGLFIYTPIALITLIVGLTLLFKKKFYLVCTFVAFFLITSFVLSSWWNWWYSCSYGQRPFVGYYPVLFIFFALGLNYLNKKISAVLIVISLLTIPLNHIQARQYKNYILHWEDMNEIKYWNVFLSNSNRFIAFNWKQYFNCNNRKLIKSIHLGNKIVFKNSCELVYRELIDSKTEIHKAGLLKVSAVNTFERNERAEMCLYVLNGIDTVIQKQILVSNLTEQKFGTKHRGYYVFELPKFNKEKIYKLYLEVKSKETNLNLNSVLISYRE